MQAGVTVLMHDTSSDRAFQMSEDLSKDLKRFSSYKEDTICDVKYSRGNNWGNMQIRVTILLHNTLPGSVFTNHSSEHSSSCSPDFSIFKSI